MQTNVPTPQWLSWLVQPAIVLGGVGLFVRLVAWPALQMKLRQDLKPDLDKIAVNESAVSRLEMRADATDKALVALQGVPLALERIETNMENMTKNVDEIKKIVDRRAIAPVPRVD
jgi:hypothetical protein